MHEVYLLTGSNQGNRRGQLARAQALIEERCGSVTAVSGIYETEAWGLKDQPGFLNQALGLQTGLEPLALLQTVKAIELEVGRVQTVKWGPRVIDIDILLYAGKQVNLPELVIPHPYIQERRFTLVPLADIAAAVVHPVLGKTIAELLAVCPDTSEVKTYS